MITFSESAIRTLRSLAAIALFAAGWLLILSVRTTQFGENIQSLKIYLLFGSLVFGVAVLIFWDRTNTRKMLQIALLFALVVILAASLWAIAEEQLVVQVLSHTCQAESNQCDDLTSEKTFVYQRRIFTYHTISFSPDYGWQGGD